MWPPDHSLITGASSGIGASLSRLLARPGSLLSLHGRDAERLSAVAASCRRSGSEVSTILGDVRDRQHMAATIADAEARQPLDLVIANAGVSGGGLDDARRIIDINVGGVLNTVEPALAVMRERGGGRIAIMASIAGFKSFPNAPLYCASKAAVRSYGEALAAQARPDNVMVTVLCPGFVETPLTAANPFPMPLILPADKAAEKLLHGIARGRTRVTFPWPLYALSRLLELLPADWSRALLTHMARNQGLKE